MSDIQITVGNGVPGPQGVRGSTWTVSDSAPSGGSPISGDLHLNSTTGQIYKYTGTAWAASGTLSSFEVKGSFISDAAAAAGGVAVGEIYETALGNLYGLPDGVLKRRKS